MATNKKDRIPFHEEFAEKIIKMLEEGTAPWQKPWTPAQNMAPRNPLSGTVYRGVNRLHLAMQGYADPRWMTLKQANDAGYRIKQGSRSTPVVYYQFTREQDKMDENGQPVLGDDGTPVRETVELARPILRMARVFNAAQVENFPPIPEQEKAFAWNPQEKAEAVLANSGAIIRHDQRDRAFYRPSSDEIHLPPKTRFAQADQYYATALHELGHWTGHPDRLNREFGPFGSSTYAKEELRAEISSWMVGQDIGVGHNPGQHAAYVKSWIAALKDDPLEIMRACRDAERIHDFVLSMEMQKEKSVEHAMDEAPETMDMAPPPVQAAQERTYLHIPYQDKEQAKALGARWDARQKQWYAPEGTDLAPLRQYLSAPENKPSMEFASKTSQEKTYLHVPYKDKNVAKALGARWDARQKQWYAPEGTDLEPLQRFLPNPERCRDMDTLSPQEEFARKLADLGLDLKGQLPEMDGQIHRVPLLSKQGHGLDGSYCLHGDGRPAGWAQNHVTGDRVKLVASGVILSPAEIEKQRQERTARLQAQEQERAKAHEAAAQRCQAMWDSFSWASSSPYLERKGVSAFGLKEDQGNLIVPLKNAEGQLRGFQAIAPDGQKTFARGMEKKGNFHLIGADEKDLSQGEILLCEGYATGASLHMATGKAVAVAFDSGNLLPVAEAIRAKYPNAAITICADNDHSIQREGKPYNVGLEKAKMAAQKVNGSVKTPLFTEKEQSQGLTDFNDLHKARGLEAVRHQLGLGRKIEQEKELTR